MNWKRILTVLLKTAGWVVGIWLALLIILQVALSPAILTEVINRYAEENLEAVEVAVVTEEPRLVLNWRGKKIVDLKRAFLDTNGAH